MTENEFFYWLQGFFELTLLREESVQLSLAQADCVKRHISLTRASLRRGQQLGERVVRIEMAIDMLDDSPGLSGIMTTRIQQDLDAAERMRWEASAIEARRLHRAPGGSAEEKLACLREDPIAWVTMRITYAKPTPGFSVSRVEVEIEGSSIEVDEGHRRNSLSVWGADPDSGERIGLGLHYAIVHAAEHVLAPWTNAAEQQQRKHAEDVYQRLTAQRSASERGES